MSKKENLKRILLCVFIFALSLTFISWTAEPDAVSYRKHNPNVTFSVTNDSVSVTYSNDTIQKKDSIKELLNAEVYKFIHKKAPDAHSTVPSYIVEKCLDSNIDICFMMSQTFIETNFGTSGAGRSCSRRSLFGVYKKRYSNYIDAIDDYVHILKTNYMVNGKTEYDLMKNYVTKSGYRYAGSKSYEGKLKNTYNGIKAKTNIFNLQQQYRKLS